jgi:hypothetical protein
MTGMKVIPRVTVHILNTDKVGVKARYSQEEMKL